ncbi:sodium-dependent glucose transporter 1A-like [Clavelina lepadiformis]|uniref:sodium-dependent glucose transporter 1A-like n=1 Tax=Clavelina lepadiformis TaxID=159417 RepID=UPI0040411715
MQDSPKKHSVSDDEVSEKFIEEEISKHDQTKDNSKLGDSSDFHRYMLSAALAAGFLGLGASIMILGLALPTLAENLHKTINDLSLVLIVRGGGYVSGSFIAGALESKVDFYYLTTISLLLMAIGMILTPMILNVASFYICTAVSSIGMGGVETVANVLCLYLWGKKSEPVLQFLHFWFCFGHAITPFLAKPFLNEVFHNSSLPNNSSSAVTITSFQNITFIEDTTLPLVSVPYFVIAGFLMTVIIFLLPLKLFFLLNLTNTKHEHTIEQEETSYRYTMLFLIFLIYFFLMGGQVVLATFLYKFAISEKPGPAYTRDVASDLNAVLFFSVLIGQFFAIFWSQKFSPEKILAADFLGVGVSAITMLFYPLYSEAVPTLIWIAVAVLGFSQTSIYASMFLWANRYITINGSAAAVFIFGGSLGEMVLTIPVGLLIEDHVLSLLYFHCGYVFALILMYVVTLKFAQTKGERSLKNNPTELDKLQTQSNPKLDPLEQAKV